MAEKPSKTRNKKHRVKGERRRIRIETLMSSDEEENLSVPNKDVNDRKRKSSESTDKLSRAEKVCNVEAELISHVLDMPGVVCTYIIVYAYYLVFLLGSYVGREDWRDQIEART